MLADNSILLFAGLLLIAAIQRLLCVYFWGGDFSKEGFSGDASVHYGMIRHIKNGRNQPYIPNYLIAPEPYSYPIFFHRLAALMPLWISELYGWVPNLLISVAGYGVFVLLLTMSGAFSMDAIIAISFLYFLSPLQWVFRGPNIAYLGLSERYLARVWNSLYYLSLFLNAYTGDYTALLVAPIFGGFALTSGKFARQAILFVTPILSIFVGYEPLLALLGSFVLAFVFGGSRFRRGMYHSALQWRIYRTHTKASPHVLAALSGFFRWEFDSAKSRLHNILKNLVNQSPTREIFTYPEFLLLPFLFLLPHEFSFKVYAFFILAAVIIYILVCTERFNHLGEAYRYLEYSLTYLLPCLVYLTFDELAAHYALEQSVLFFFFATLYLPISVLFILQFGSFYTRAPIDDHLSAFLQQAGVPEDAIVFPVTMRLGADIVARLAQAKSFWWQPGLVSRDIYAEYIEEYPYIKRDWKPLAKKHGVTHIVCSKHALSQLSTWHYDFSDQVKLAETDRYIAYKVVL